MDLYKEISPLMQRVLGMRGVGTLSSLSLQRPTISGEALHVVLVACCCAMLSSTIVVVTSWVRDRSLKVCICWAVFFLRSRKTETGSRNFSLYVSHFSFALLKHYARVQMFRNSIPSALHVRIIQFEAVTATSVGT
jgi:hypothetical protein